MVTAMSRTVLALFFGLIYLFISSIALADLNSRVISILYGDTIEVLHNQHEDGPKSPTGISKEDERMSTGEGSYCFPLVIGSPSADPH